MNPETPQSQETGCCSCGPAAARIFGGLAAFLVLAAMVGVVRHYSTPAPVGVEKTALREKNLKEIQAAGVEALGHYAVLDPAKGLVRIPVTDAMKAVEAGYKNPTAFRSDMMARLVKAYPPPPPKEPEKPSQFE
ncbi:MAG: hypothetical protein FJ404_04285 [Verrucomicrobia bacterium]|nr:hypothetical protein [Verrucomicrobiota bacterium]